MSKGTTFGEKIKSLILHQWARIDLQHFAVDLFLWLVIMVQALDQLFWPETFVCNIYGIVVFSVNIILICSCFYAGTLVLAILLQWVSAVLSARQYGLMCLKSAKERLAKTRRCLRSSKMSAAFLR